MSSELSAKTALISDLEGRLMAQGTLLKHAQDELEEVKVQLGTSKSRCMHLEGCVDCWTTKTQPLEANQNATGSELNLAKSEIVDLQCQLNTSRSRNSDLQADYARLTCGSPEVITSTTILRNVVESQLEKAGTPHPKSQNLAPLHREQRIAEQRINADAGSADQLTAVGDDQLAVRSRRIDNLEGEFLFSSQQIAILNTSLEEKDNKQDSVNLDIECTKSTKGSNADRIQELTEDDLHQMKHRLETKTDELIQQHVRADAQQVYLEKVSEELVEVKCEKQNLEKLLSSMVAERYELNAGLVQAKLDISRSRDVAKQPSAAHCQTVVIKMDYNRALSSNQEVENLQGIAGEQQVEVSKRSQREASAASEELSHDMT